MLRGGWAPMRGDTNLFIGPGFRFRATGAMLTNFHLPQSSLFAAGLRFRRPGTHFSRLPARC